MTQALYTDLFLNRINRLRGKKMSQIEIQDLQVSFSQRGKTFNAVKNVNLSINSGEIFGIVGLSGAGKSTLVRTLNLLQKPTSGQILVDGQDITKFKGQALRDFRKTVGMIFQQFNLTNNRTVAQNIEFALKAADVPKEKRDKRINELLEIVDLLDKKDAYPRSLSGGQKQRIGIARALANNPKILLSDEATSALDLETTEEILKILLKINQELGITIIFITHELEVAKKLFDRVAVMENGEVVELKTTYDLFANPESQMAKKLITRFLNLEIPNEIVADLHDGILMELRYQGENTLDALITKIAQKYQVDISILHGKIEYIAHQAIGILQIYITGGNKNEAAKAFETEVAAIKYLRGEING